LEEDGKMGNWEPLSAVVALSAVRTLYLSEKIVDARLMRTALLGRSAHVRREKSATSHGPHVRTPHRLTSASHTRTHVRQSLATAVPQPATSHSLGKGRAMKTRAPRLFFDPGPRSDQESKTRWSDGRTVEWANFNWDCTDAHKLPKIGLSTR
jgi:hypothetical protein